jgi:uncharacterized membrane protein
MNIKRQDDMKDRTRFRAFLGIVFVVIILGTIFVVMSVNSGDDNWATLMSAAIVVSMATIALIVARIKLKDLKSGTPSEDERSRAIRMRAGYLAFYISMFLFLGMSFFHAIIENNEVSSLPTSEWLMIYVAAMGSIFLVLNAFLKRKGVLR